MPNHFSIKVKLKHHKNIIQGLRPYIFRVCAKGFSQPAHLKLHKRTYNTMALGPYIWSEVEPHGYSR